MYGELSSEFRDMRGLHFLDFLERKRHYAHEFRIPRMAYLLQCMGTPSRPKYLPDQFLTYPLEIRDKARKGQAKVFNPAYSNPLSRTHVSAPVCVPVSKYFRSARSRGDLVCQ
jgi:hypothetical protein